MLVELKTVVKVLRNDTQQLESFLKSFSCVADSDIELFLHNRAVMFEALSKSRTYLVCDADELEHKGFKDAIIYGYFSLALKALEIPEDKSNRVRKELDGFSAKLHDKPIRHIACYLIGQLARNSNVPQDSITGAELLRSANKILDDAVDAVGGRRVLVECRDNPKLIDFYTRNGFEQFDRIPADDGPMVQLLQRIG